MTAESVHPAAAPTSPAIRRWRAGLLAIGVGLLVVGGVLLALESDPSEWVGLLLWLALALVVHDGLVAFGVFGVQLLLRRAGRRMPVVVLAIAQGAVVIGAIVALVVIPQIYKSAVGASNPSVVPLDYVANLVAFLAALAVTAAIVIGLYLRIAARRQNVRPSIIQD
ncbi:MAG: hypothetical protein RI885_1995 [Actinomycetota bacterium]